MFGLPTPHGKFFFFCEVSQHVNRNAEELRHHFVNFDGKVKLVICRNGFVKGSHENDWAGCFDEWAEQIEGFVGSENKETLVSFYRFSLVMY